MAAADSGGNHVLVHKHVFGLKVDVKDHLQYLDENNVVYPCGHNTVIYNIETREQSLIHGMHAGMAVDKGATPHESEGITALAITPNRRYIGVAERCADRGIVNIYDAQTYRRRRVLNYAEIGSKEIVSIAFSADSKQALTLGGAPDWTLILWTTDRTAKVAASIKLSHGSHGAAGLASTLSSPEKATSGGVDVGFPIRQADFCPSDPNIVCVSGNGVLKLLKVTEGTFRPMAISLKRDPQNFMCHAWLPEDRLVLATDHGELLLFENFEFRMVLSSSPQDGEPLCCIQPYSKGFVCGGAGGTMRIYERSDDIREYYKCSKTFNIENNRSAIVQLAVSPSEDSLVCSTENFQLYNFALSNTDILKEDSGANFDYLTACGFHGPGPAKSAMISGMDVCVWKPLLATCGQDRTVRIWNYQEKTAELTKRFQEEPHSIALHPSGLYVVVGFTDKLRLMSLLIDDMRVVKEISVKSCRECRFAHGGHMFAVVNQTAVQIFDTYTCTMRMQLREHQQTVRSIIWTDNDRKIVTVGKDGNVYLWDTKTGEHLHENMQPRTTFVAAALAGGANAPTSRLYAYSADRTLKAFTAMNMSPENQIKSDVEISCMSAATNGRALFIGAAEASTTGTIIVYLMKDGKLPGLSAAQASAAASSGDTDIPGRHGHSKEESAAKSAAVETGPFPPPQPASLLDAQIFVAHSSPVSCMQLSSDGNLLFTGGEDGCLCIFEVRDVDARGVVRLQSTVKEKSISDGSQGVLDFTEEILVTKTDLVAKKRENDTLIQKVEELKLNNEHQLRQKDMKYKDKIKDVTEKFQTELDSNRNKFEKLATEKNEMEMIYEERLEKLRNGHGQELEERKEQYRVKIDTERQRKDALQEERKVQNQEWDALNAQIVAEHTDQLNKLTTTYDAKAAAEQRAQSLLQSEKDELLQKWDRTRKCVEDDSDFEVEDIKMKYEQKLKAEQEMTLSLKGENIIMRKKFNVLTKEVKDQVDEIKGLEESEKQYRDILKGLEKDIQGHKKEIREREETIADKEKRIYDLKKKNQELEKFKFVLDYKIKELKRQIEPRENEIADMRTQVEEMDLELEQYHKSNSALDLMIGELRLKMEGMQREINSQQTELANSQDYMARYRRDLEGATRYLDDYKMLKTAVRGIYTKYVQEQSGLSDGNTDSTGGGGEMDAQMEYNRQREHLERNVEALKRKISKDVDMFMGDNARLMREGVSLTEEMNLLRREAKLLRRRAKTLDIEETAVSEGMFNGPTPPTGSRNGSSNVAGGRKLSSSATQAEKEIEMQENQIAALESEVNELKVLLGEA